MPRLDDYLLRVRRASVPELAYRLRRTLLAWRWRRRLGRGLAPPQPPRIDAAAAENIRMPEMHSTLDAGALAALLGGQTCTLNTDPGSIRAFEDGQRDRFFSRVQARKSALDIRAVWEPARLQHFTALLAHLRHHPDDPERETIQAFIRDGLVRWVRDNRFLRGPHFLSPMECGLRIPVFVLGLGIIDGWPNDQRRRILQAVYEHAWWVYRNRSLHASLGNHTICECVGLVFAGAVFQDTREGRRWLDRGLDLLQTELSHQILEDGGPAEQSIGYLRFVVDLYWLAIDFMERNHLKRTDFLQPRLIRAEGFLAAFHHAGAHWPDIGDSDNGHALAPGLTPRRPAASMRAHAVSHFSAAGYTVVRPGTGTVVVFDHGPLGMPPLYNHGHADALSVHLMVRGQPILVDPGTYRYNGEPEWRRYFKGTRAHNTVTIDDCDQADQAGGFVWTHPFTCRVQRFDDSDDGLAISACHDGYRRLGTPVVHCRTILWDHQKHLLVEDAFLGSGRHRYELHFHLHPRATVKRAYGHWCIRNDAATVQLKLTGQGDFEAVNGRIDPPLGWFSPAYGIQEPCTVLKATCSGRPKDVRFRTLIWWE